MDPISLLLMAQTAVSAIRSTCQFLAEGKAEIGKFKKQVEGGVADAKAIFNEVTGIWAGSQDSLVETQSQASSQLSQSLQQLKQPNQPKKPSVSQSQNLVTKNSKQGQSTKSVKTSRSTSKPSVTSKRTAENLKKKL